MPVRASLLTYPLRLGAIVLLLGVTATAVRMFVANPIDGKTDPEALFVSIALAVAVPFMDERVEPFMDRWVQGWSAASPNPPPPGTGWGWSRAYGVNPSLAPFAAWRSGHIGIRWTVVALACSAATFVVLPVVRRRARVRWVHVHRASIYGLALVPLIAIVGWTLDTIMLLHWWGRANQWWSALHLDRTLPWELALIPAMLFPWWWCVAQRYMRLERPVAVAASVTVIGSLSCIGVHFLATPRQLDHWLLYLH
ncbi:MAG: hypothetical protein FJ253_12385 [Phycisphaerae bacterium]|nr:hypothetical protein [Phycisphaerae bacterium]